MPSSTTTTTGTDGNAGAALDQKKRAFEALERRFSVKTNKEIQPQNQNDIKKLLKQDKTCGSSRDNIEEEASLDSPSTDFLAKKGKCLFFGDTNHSRKVKDEQTQHPMYHKLSQIFHENLTTINAESSSRGADTINKVLHNLLQNGDFARKYKKGSKNTKVDNYFLLDNFVPSNQVSSKDARVKVLQSHSKRSKKCMSMKQHKKHGSLDLPQDFHKFELFKPIHEMWKDYIGKLLKETGRNQIPQRILAADLHGAILLVVGCKATQFIGICGIMIRETAETFGIILNDDKFRVVPKKGSVFILQAGSWKITLHGDKLSSMRDII